MKNNNNNNNNNNNDDDNNNNNNNNNNKYASIFLNINLGPLYIFWYWNSQFCKPKYTNKTISQKGN